MPDYHNPDREHEPEPDPAESWGAETDAFRYSPTPTEARWFRGQSFKTERLLDLLERAHTRLAYLGAMRDYAGPSAYLLTRIDAMIAVTRGRVRRLSSMARAARREERRREAPTPAARRLGVMSPVIAGMIARLRVGHDG